ncbi:hypothetical protein D3C75_1261330 [compost metagenome]
MLNLGLFDIADNDRQIFEGFHYEFSVEYRHKGMKLYTFLFLYIVSKLILSINYNAYNL